MPEYSPERGDLSGFLHGVALPETIKGARRRSFSSGSGKKKERLWVVQDAQLLTWYDGVDGKERGYGYGAELTIDMLQAAAYERHQVYHL